MKRIGIGDVHLSGFQSDPIDKGGLPQRLGLIIQSLINIAEYAKANNISHLDILGDLINDKSIIYTVAQDAFKDFLEKYRELNFRIISGNHDLSSTGETQRSAISVFGEYPNVECISLKPQILDGIAYVPFTKDFIQVVRNIDANILVSHLGLNEATLQSGLSRVDKIKIRDIAKFKLSILGHYHKPQHLKSGESNIYYAGSLIHKDWSDKNEQKRFLVYDTETLEVESIDITGLPEYKEYIIEDASQRDEVIRLSEIARNAGHRVRIRNKTKDKLTDFVSGGVLVLENNEVDITNRGIEITQTKTEQLKKYLEIKEIPEDQREEYLNVTAKHDLLKIEGASGPAYASGENIQDVYIDHIKLKNVRSHLDMEMDFPVDNFTIFVGENGAGKSTIPKSVSMALYGDDGAVKGERLTITEMVNRKENKNLEIILKFRIVEGEITDKYEIKLYYEHAEHGSGLSFWKNGIDISGSTKSDTYKKIEAKLIPRDVYHNAYYFSQQVKNFFTSLTNTAQKEIFDSILQTKEYDVFYETTKSVIADFVKEMQIMDGQIDRETTSIQIKTQTLSDLVNSKKRSLEEHETKAGELRTVRVKKENQIQVVDLKIDGYSDLDQAALNNWKVELSSLEENLRNTQQKLDNELANLFAKNESDIETDKLKLQARVNEKINEVRREHSDQREKLTTELNNIFSLYKDIEAKYNVSAAQNDHLEFQKEKQKEHNEVNSELQKLNDEFSINHIQDECKLRLKSVEEAIQKEVSTVNSLNEKIAQLNSQAKEKQSSIKLDEESLDADVSVCSKCLRPFSDAKSSEALKNSIEAEKLVLQKLIDSCRELREELNKAMLQREEAVQHKEKIESDYQEKIFEVEAKKKSRSDDLYRKRDLILKEVEAHKEQIEAKIAKIEADKKTEVDEWNKKKSQIEINIAGVDSLINKSIENLNLSCNLELENSKQEHNKKYGALQAELRQKSKNETDSVLSRKIKLEADIEATQKLVVELDELKLQRNNLRVELSSINDRIKEHSEFVFDDSQIEKITSEIQLHNTNKDDTIQTKALYVKEVNILEFWKIAFSDAGIKSMLIDMAIPHMNKSVMEALERVAPGVYTVSFDTLKETKGGDIRDKFNVRVLHNIKGTDSHKMLSGGEKRLVDLACMDALRSLAERLYGKRFHNIFYDEVLDSLDDNSCQAFCQASKLLSAGKNVTMITHNVAENMEPDRVFKF